MKNKKTFIEILKNIRLSDINENENNNLSDEDKIYYETQKAFIENKHTNKNYNKFRKYKELYFIEAFILYKEKKISNFFADSNHKWWAFDAGPVLDTYCSRGLDKEIFIISNKKNLKLITEAVGYLDNYGTKFLIEMSHKEGTPWQKYYEKGKKFTEIPNESIIEHFKNNKPFFIK